MSSDVMGGRWSVSCEGRTVAAVLTERWPKLDTEPRSKEYSEERVEAAKGEL